MSQVVDYSEARPDPAAIKAAGYVGVMRYLAPLPNKKVLQAPELASLTMAGLAVGLVWETTANRTSGGAAAGIQDAKAADRMATDLGFPVDRPVYYATDGNVYNATILAYYQGAMSATPRPVGVYGNAQLLDACAGLGIRYGWHVSTWGHTANACLRQEANQRPTIPGTDVNSVLRDDWGQLGGHTTTPIPTLLFGAHMIRVFVEGVGWFLWAGGRGDPLVGVGQAEFEAATLIPLFKTTKDSPSWKTIQDISNSAAVTVGTSSGTGSITFSGTGKVS